MARGLFPKGVLCLAAAVLFGFVSQARAQDQTTASDTLLDLSQNGGVLTVGDKVFSNFDFLASGLTSFDPSQILVTASFANGVYFLTWGGNMSLASAGPATADLLLNYTVTATAGLISTIDQLYTGSAQTAGGSFIAIDETVRNTNGDLVASSHLDTGDISDPTAEPGDSLVIDPPQGVLNVTKDIAYGITAANGGFVTISEVRQSFHQTQVPEASTTVLLAVGLALVGLVAFRQRRSA